MSAVEVPRGSQFITSQADTPRVSQNLPGLLAAQACVLNVETAAFLLLIKSES